MPELPEVEAICRMLRERLSGQKVIDVNVFLPRIIRQGDAIELIGQSFRGVYRRGKYICFDLNGSLKMYAHLRMTGAFLWKDDLEKPATHIRLEIDLENGCLQYRDVRTFGGIWILRDDAKPWKKLGLDPFDPKFTAQEFYKRLKSRKITVKQAILDQTLLAGLGNIYSSEALFAAAIHPARKSSSLKKNEVIRLREAIVEILSAAIDANGTTFRDFRLSNGREGSFQQFLKVYTRKDQPCRLCRSKIKRVVIAQRSTYFCPKCQH